MAATVLHSFAELAKVLGGNKVKAKKVVELATFTNVLEKCGRKASVIWAFLQEQEACKRYGAKGEILHNLNQLKVVTEYEDGVIVRSVMALVRYGFARMTPNGEYVRAA
jgi:hypothetical protein